MIGMQSGTATMPHRQLTITSQCPNHGCLRSRLFVALDARME